MHHQRVTRLSVILLALLATLPTRATQPADSGSAHPSSFPPDLAALIEVAATVVRMTPEAQALWPGFWSPPRAFIVYRPRAMTVLVTSTVPPAHFAPIDSAALPRELEGLAYSHMGPLPGLEGNFDIDYPVGELRAVAVAAAPEGARHTIETLFHEGFHGFQAEVFARTSAATGDFVDPADIAIPDFAALAGAERRMLADALSMPADGLVDHLRDYLAVRDTRLRAVPEYVRVVERRLERSEGSAHLVGLQAGLFAVPAGRGDLENALLPFLTRSLESHPGGPAERLIRWRVYGTGAAIGLLLDRLRIDWRARLQDGATFEALLREAVRFDPEMAAELAAIALERYPPNRVPEGTPGAQVNPDVRSVEEFYALAPTRLIVELDVPLADGGSGLNVHFTGGFSQLSPNQLVIPEPEPMIVQVPGASLVVRGRPVLQDASRLAAGRLRLVVALPALPDLGAPPGPAGAPYRLPLLDIRSNGVGLRITDPVWIRPGPDELLIRPASSEAGPDAEED